ncbi:MAG: hypothetical protein ABIW34_13390 [Ginsengibacter sp.]
MMNNNFAKERIVIERLVLVYILFFLLFRYFTNATPSHILQPPLYLIQFDPLYWLFKFSFLSLINSNQLAADIFDAILFASCALAILFPLKRLFVIFFSLFLLIYAVIYNISIVHHAHPLSLTIIVTLPFWVRRSTDWKLMWEGMRYYVCFIYTASFIWKSVLGNSFFVWNNGVTSTKLNLAEYIYHNPYSFSAGIMKYFIAHPALLNTGHVLVILFEGCMVIGFFTKKYDKLLILLPVIIHLATYFFSDVFFIEILVGLFTFLNARQINWLSTKLPILART